MSQSTSLQTPLGNIITSLAVSDKKHLKASCSVSSPDPHLVEGVSIEKNCLIQWIIEAKKSLDPFIVLCEWEHEDPNREGGGGNPGQYYAAQTWIQNNQILTIGTYDGQALSLQAYEEKNIPKRFFKGEQTSEHFDCGWLDWIEYTSKGFRINIPALHDGESVKLSFGVAWASITLDEHGLPDDYPTWSAAQPSG